MRYLVCLPEIADRLDSIGLHREADILDSVMKKSAVALSYKEKPILRKFAKIIMLLKKTKPGAKVERTDLVFPQSKDPISGMDRQRALDKVIKELGSFLQYLDVIYQQRYRGTEYGERYTEFIEQVQDLTRMAEETFSSKEEKRGIREALNAVAKVKRLLEKLEFEMRAQEEEEKRVSKAMEALDRISYSIEESDPKETQKSLEDFQEALPQKINTDSPLYSAVYAIRRTFPFPVKMIENQMDLDEQRIIIERKEKATELRQINQRHEQVSRLKGEIDKEIERWSVLYDAINKTNWDLPKGGYRSIRDIPEPGEQKIVPPAPSSIQPVQESEEKGEEEWGEWGPPIKSFVTKKYVVSQKGEEEVPKLPSRPRPLHQYVDIPERKSIWARFTLLRDMIRLYAERFSEWKGLGEEVPFWLYVKRGLPTELEIQKGVERQRLIKNREIAAAELQRIDQDLRNIAQSTREEADLYYDLFLKADEDLRNMNEAYEDSYKESLWNLWHREYVAKLSQIIRYFLAPETRGGESSAQAFNRVLRKFQEVLNFRLTVE